MRETKILLEKQKVTDDVKMKIQYHKKNVLDLEEEPAENMENTQDIEMEKSYSKTFVPQNESIFQNEVIQDSKSLFYHPELTNEENGEETKGKVK